jgi:steroid delta-isomerase-like uncharacterized protein
MFRAFRLAILATFVASLMAMPGAMPGSAQEATPAAECPTTTPEENKALVEMYWDEFVWGKQGTLDELLAPDEVHHWGIGSDTTDQETYLERVDLFVKAFPDFDFTVDVIAAEGDLVVSLWTAHGTHLGEWQGIAPTGREVTWNGINIFRFECGLIAESWGQADHLGLRQQLGATDIPAMAPPAASPFPVKTIAATPCADDTVEGNVALARRWTEEVWNTQNPDILDEFVDPEIVHDGGGFPQVQGIDALKDAFARLFETFPDVALTVDLTVAEGDLVAVRWSGTATPAEPFFGAEPTGAPITMTGINIYQIDCGKIVRSWSEVNILQIVEQVREAAAATPESA